MSSASKGQDKEGQRVLCGDDRSLSSRLCVGKLEKVHW